MRKTKIWMWAFFGGIVGSSVMLCILHLFAFPTILDSLNEKLFLTQNIENLSRLPKEDIKDLERLVDGGIVTSRDRIFQATVSFYNTAVIFLIAILSLVGIFGFLYVKAISRVHAEEVADEISRKALKTYLRSIDFSDDVGMAIENTEQYKALESLDELSDRISKLEDIVSSLDGSESSGGGEID